jgi:L-histidine N-alpha-methyltransferase
VAVRRADGDAGLLREITEGLSSQPQATLPAKLLYDNRGSELFDRICQLPEYYPTRTEDALLGQVAGDVAARSECSELVELGCGLGRKTPTLLDAMTARHDGIRYVPFDVSRLAVDLCAEHLLRRYPRLTVQGVVGDFTRDLDAVPEGRRRLVALLGGTIGNFETPDLLRLMRDVARLLREDDYFLVAADLVKPKSLLHAAYNDAAGVTAEFSLNAIRRLRTEFGVWVSDAAFRHEAFFDEETSRIEMHARASTPALIEASAHGLRRLIMRGESIRTEISRKFTQDDIERLLGAAGMSVVAMYTTTPAYALALARPIRTAE